MWAWFFMSFFYSWVKCEILRWCQRSVTCVVCTWTCDKLSTSPVCKLLSCLVSVTKAHCVWDYSSDCLAWVMARVCSYCAKLRRNRFMNRPMPTTLRMNTAMPRRNCGLTHALCWSRYDTIIRSTLGLGKVQPGKWRDAGGALDNPALEGCHMPDGPGVHVSTPGYLQYNEVCWYLPLSGSAFLLSNWHRDSILYTTSLRSA